jgi:hypothetical protein
MELTLERYEAGGWRAVDPGLITDSGDRVRFRFRADFDGYLYVMNYGTTGSYTLLFPREETGRDNAVKANRDYLVPATETAFRVSGPAGQDIVYWVVSPAALSMPPPPPANRPMPSNMTPRCDDTMLRARGLCIDSSAGPKAPADDERLPENLKGAGSRDLIIVREQNHSLVSSPAPLAGPVVYEFRLSHR